MLFAYRKSKFFDTETMQRLCLDERSNHRGENQPGMMARSIQIVFLRHVIRVIRATSIHE